MDQGPPAMDISREEYLRVIPEDQRFFDHCIQGLPDQKGFRGDGLDKYGESITFSLGPHAVRWMRHFLDRVLKEIGFSAAHANQPWQMLEIGFHIGYSSALWLNLSRNVQLLSIEISDKWETLYAAERLGRLFPGRFNFLRADASQSVDRIRLCGPYQFAFIDGNHLRADLDIVLCRALKIPWMLFDDWWPDPFSTVQETIKATEDLEVVEVCGNMALARWKS